MGPLWGKNGSAGAGNSGMEGDMQTPDANIVDTSDGIYPGRIIQGEGVLFVGVPPCPLDISLVLVYAQDCQPDGFVQTLDPTVVVRMDIGAVVTQVVAVFVGDAVIFIRVEDVDHCFMGA